MLTGELLLELQQAPWLGVSAPGWLLLAKIDLCVVVLKTQPA
jgi:hypothetical protein